MLGRSSIAKEKDEYQEASYIAPCVDKSGWHTIRLSNGALKDLSCEHIHFDVRSENFDMQIDY